MRQATMPSSDRQRNPDESQTSFAIGMHAVPIWHSVPIAGEHSGQPVLTRQGNPGLRLAEDGCTLPGASKSPGLARCVLNTRLLRLTRQCSFQRPAYYCATSWSTLPKESPSPSRLRNNLMASSRAHPGRLGERGGAPGPARHPHQEIQGARSAPQLARG